MAQRLPRAVSFRTKLTETIDADFQAGSIRQNISAEPVAIWAATGGQRSTRRLVVAPGKAARIFRQTWDAANRRPVRLVGPWPAQALAGHVALVAQSSGQRQSGDRSRPLSTIFALGTSPNSTGITHVVADRNTVR